MMRIFLRMCAFIIVTAGGALAADKTIETRKANFKQNAAILKSVRGQLAAGDFKAIANGAEKIAAWAQNIPAAFPEGSDSDGASPAIWMDFDDFTAKAEANRQAAMQLKEMAEKKDTASVTAALQTLGGTCKSCHSSYKLD